jgi:hypothetical protein
VRQVLARVSNQMSNEFYRNPERMRDGDIYSIVILCIFASIIVVSPINPYIIGANFLDDNDPSNKAKRVIGRPGKIQSYTYL